MDVKSIIGSMTLEEKIGQKIMLDFRYWNQPGQTKQGMTAPNDDVRSIIINNNIGGVILFSENLKNTNQIKTLTSWYASIMTKQGARLLVGTDNEGGNVFRLPRGEYPSFPGNMALGAAVEGGASSDLAFQQGKRMAQDMTALYINTNFAPVADINTNPYNPVINVRAFSDDVDTVVDLAEQLTAGMRSEKLITAYKHYPGHGAASTDSHKTLPSVNRTREEAFAIDLAPYRRAIEKNIAPDMVMTAHIQYPSLDDSLITTKNNENIVVPATMSREIQSCILRDRFGFEGVTISDALNMGAIVEYFDQEPAIEYVFRAGLDIALMPVSIYQESDKELLPKLIKFVADKVRIGVLDEAEITASVERIMRLKLAHSLVGTTAAHPGGVTCQEHDVTREPHHMPRRDDTLANVEKEISDKSITLLKNEGGELPIKDLKKKFFILTTWKEQGEGIAAALRENGYENVKNGKMGEILDVDAEIRECDVFVMGVASANFDRSDPTIRRILDWLLSAKNNGKIAVYVSLRAPYDIAYYVHYGLNNFLATYSYYGYEDGVWRGPSMRSLAEILIGKLKPAGKLPVDTWRSYDAQKNAGIVELPYKRGYGLSGQQTKHSFV